MMRLKTFLDPINASHLRSAGADVSALLLDFVAEKTSVVLMIKTICARLLKNKLVRMTKNVKVKDYVMSKLTGV